MSNEANNDEATMAANGSAASAKPAAEQPNVAVMAKPSDEATTEAKPTTSEREEASGKQAEASRPATSESDGGKQDARATSNKKPKAGKWGIARHTVQVLILLFFLMPVVVTGWSIAGGDLTGEALNDAVATPAQFPWYGTLSSSTIGPVTLLDPFVVLQVIAAAKAFDPAWLLAALPPLLVFAIVRGRAFCGWVCPVNLVLEVVDAIRKRVAPKQQLPEHKLPRHAKLGVAAGILVLSAIVSMPVYEIFNPISFINKGLVFGSVVGGVTLVAIILIDVFWGHRVWCRSLCPLGGFYEMLGKIGLVRVGIDNDACIKCGHCKKACIADPEILEPAIEGETKTVCAGDCMACGKCIDACPTKALAMKISLPK